MRERIRNSNQITLDEREILIEMLDGYKKGNVRKSYEEVFGDGVNTSFIINHNLDNYNINIFTEYSNTGESVFMYHRKLNSNQLLIQVNRPPDVGEYTVYINV